MDPPFNSKKKKSTPGGFSQLKSLTLKEKELHGPGGGGESCNDLPLNLYKKNFMDSAYNLKKKKSTPGGFSQLIIWVPSMRT